MTEPMSLIDVRQCRRHQLSLICLGAALAGRESLLSGLMKSAVTERERGCIEAIRARDKAAVAAYLGSRGVECGESPIQSVVNRLNEVLEQEAVEDTLKALTKSGLYDDLDSAEAKLQKAIEIIRESKKDVFIAKESTDEPEQRKAG